MDTNKIKIAIREVEKCKKTIASKKATIGFDGYIDELVSIVKNRKSVDDYNKFRTMQEFGDFISGNMGSCGLEMVTNQIKVGGNGPIFADALVNAGVQMNCIGTFGLPVINEIFRDLAGKCNMVSIGNPAYTQAFEFEDGKMMLGKHDNLNELKWETIEKIIGIEEMVGYLADSDLIGITNWSELIHSNDLWAGILCNCMPQLQVNKNRYIYFDLADPSKRDQADLAAAVGLIEAFSNYGKVVLGLNSKEANMIYNLLYDETNACVDSLFLGPKIQAKMQIEMLVIHSAKQVAAFHQGKVYCEECIRIDKPKILTGCGDNFNAGLCLGLLMDLPVDLCLITGICTASYYIQHGKSGYIDELLEYMLKEGDVENE